MPKVSIVIVNWKTPDLLCNCLRSVYADKGSSSFEIWMVDNASNDGSVDLVRKQFPSVIVVANDQNVGFSKACNQVIPKAAGEYILLLNPDSIVVDDAISRLIQFMDTHSNCGAVGPKVLNADGSLQLACRRAFPTPGAAFFRLTYLSKLFPRSTTAAKYNLTYADPDTELEVDALSGACMMVRRTAVEQVGLLDEDIFLFGEDIDWCWRIKQAGSKVFYCPEAVVYHYHGASSRVRPVGATIDLHHSMQVFYRKYFAHKYPAAFNALIYTAIWFRAAVFVLVNLLRSARLSTPKFFAREFMPR
jgi:GT2 family glycosyltransferase